MTEDRKTHTEHRHPQFSLRYLADYMAATEISKRSIVSTAKYRPIARLIQHDEAKLTISKFLMGRARLEWLTEEAQRIRERMADDDFDIEVNEHNADYIDRFARIQPGIMLPEAEVMVPGATPSLILNGVKITANDIRFRLRRVARSNKVKIGAATLRYAKGKKLASTVADWQSAILHGYLIRTSATPDMEPEHKLCITIDAFSGICHPAPTNSLSRFNQLAAACASISERWPNVPPPSGSVL